MLQFDEVNDNLNITAPEGTAYIIHTVNGVPEHFMTVLTVIGNPEKGEHEFLFLDAALAPIGEKETLTI